MCLFTKIMIFKRKNGIVEVSLTDFVNSKPQSLIRVHQKGLHVKIPENYFKILEEGKNVGKFIFRRNVKIPEIFSEIMYS